MEGSLLLGPPYPRGSGEHLEEGWAGDLEQPRAASQQLEAR